MKNPRITFTMQSLDRLKYGTLRCYACSETVQFKGTNKLKFYAFIEPNLHTEHKAQAEVHIVCTGCVSASGMREALPKLIDMNHNNGT